MSQSPVWGFAPFFPSEPLSARRLHGRTDPHIVRLSPTPISSNPCIIQDGCVLPTSVPTLHASLFVRPLDPPARPRRRCFRRPPRLRQPPRPDPAGQLDFLTHTPVLLFVFLPLLAVRHGHRRGLGRRWLVGGQVGLVLGGRSSSGGGATASGQGRPPGQQEVGRQRQRAVEHAWSVSCLLLFCICSRRRRAFRWGHPQSADCSPPLPPSWWHRATSGRRALPRDGSHRRSVSLLIWLRRSLVLIVSCILITGRLQDGQTRRVAHLSFVLYSP